MSCQATARRPPGGLTARSAALAEAVHLGQIRAVRSLGLVVMVVAATAFAQVDEYATPEFPHADAGVEAPPSPPPLVDSPPAITPAPATKPVDKGPPKEPRWNRLTGSGIGLISGWKNYSVGLEFFLGVNFGTPTIDGPKREVSGVLIVPGLEVLWGRLSGPVCNGSELCGQQWGGGLGVRIGHATGLARHDGTIRLNRFIFGELSATAASVNVPPAPLTQGARWGEGVFRLRGGVQLNASSLSNLEANGVIIHLTGHVEYVAFHVATQGVQVGAAFGLAF